MDKKKINTNRHTIVHKKQHGKIKTKQHVPHYELVGNQVLQKGKQILLHRKCTVGMSFTCFISFQGYVSQFYSNFSV